MSTQTRAPSAPQSPLTTIKNFLELVKFSHTIFALPFALAAMLVAANGWPPLSIVGWIVLCMFSARTAAMGYNRIVDRKIDALNPRTQNREIPAGKVTVAQAAILVVVSSALFVFATAMLNGLALMLSLPTLLLLFFYSLCKRFTSLSHLVLGLCLGIAPIGAWVATLGKLEAAPILLGAGVMLWVAGFDIIYATMDDDFDREHGLHSMVQKFGISRALWLARIFHLGFIVLLGAFGAVAQLGGIFFGAVALIAAFMVYEHAIVKPDDLRRVNAAFFTVNGVVSAFFLVAVVAEVFVR